MGRIVVLDERALNAHFPCEETMALGHGIACPYSGQCNFVPCFGDGTVALGEEGRRSGCVG